MALASVPRVRLPSLPSIGLPGPVRAVASIIVLVLLLFGPHVWWATSAVEDAQLFGEVPLGGPPPLLGVLFGTASTEDVLDGLDVVDDPPEDADSFPGEVNEPPVEDGDCTASDLLLIDVFDGEDDGSCGVQDPQTEPTSVYDQQPLGQPDGATVDQLITQQDLWNSGGWDWDEQRFADVAFSEDNLVVVSVASQRQRDGRDPDQWLPDNDEGACAVATMYVMFKDDQGLSVTTAQRDVLADALNAC